MRIGIPCLFRRKQGSYKITENYSFIFMQPNCWLEPAHRTSMINACFLEATKIINKFKTCTYSSSLLIITEANILSKIEPDQDAKIFCNKNHPREQAVCSSLYSQQRALMGGQQKREKRELANF